MSRMIPLTLGRTCSWFAITCLYLSAQSSYGAAPSMSAEYSTLLRSGDVRKLQTLLEQGASANAVDKDGDTALMRAAVYGDVASLRLLLNKGADVNAANAAGATALMRAAGDYEKANLLVKRGADVNARSGLGNTALMLAARPANSHRTVELLLAHGANLKATNQFGATALMAAVAGGDEQSVRTLIKHGADVNAQPTPDQMGFLLGGGRSPLMWAAFRGDANIVELLIDSGAEVNAMTGFGTALGQAAWADRTAAARVLIEHGARVNQAGPVEGYTPLHWAAGSEGSDASLVKLLLQNGANPNVGGGESVDAFLGTPQTPLMLARRRGDTAILEALSKGGATNGTPDRTVSKTPPARELPKQLDRATLQTAINGAIPPLQETAIKSKEAYVRHASKQDCVSCHQQFLPMAAVGLAKKDRVTVDHQAEADLVKMVLAGELKNSEVDLQPLFHPDAAYTKGYALLGLAAEEVPADAHTDSWVHHLTAIQGKDGQWYNNLPRPPIQTGDIGATALAVQALQHYTLPGRKTEFAKRIDRARQWLWQAKPDNNEGRIYQLLGLAWAGESSRKLQPLAKALIAEQQSDGGWAQVPGLKTDAYATGQAVYALRVAAGLNASSATIDRGLRYLLTTQLEDGTWFVRRRAFPFQPTTIPSHFPHGKDAWISAAATSWAVMALSLPAEDVKVALSK